MVHILQTAMPDGFRGDDEMVHEVCPDFDFDSEVSGSGSGVWGSGFGLWFDDY